MTANGQRRIGALFAAWLAIFIGISVLLWIATRFWGRNLKLAVSPGTAAVQPGVRVLPPPNNAPVLDLEEVTESNAKPSFVGRRVRFDNLNVTEAGKRTFRVGRGGGKTLMVTPPQPERPEVRVGEKVYVSGLILNVPDAATVQKEWLLDSAQAASLELEQVYLRASTIEKR